MKSKRPRKDVTTAELEAARKELEESRRLLEELKLAVESADDDDAPLPWQREGCCHQKGCK
jgi:hypothetical protein